MSVLGADDVAHWRLHAQANAADFRFVLLGEPRDNALNALILPVRRRLIDAQHFRVELVAMPELRNPLFVAVPNLHVVAVPGKHQQSDL